jgi:hypothetical protein
VVLLNSLDAGIVHGPNTSILSNSKAAGVGVDGAEIAEFTHLHVWEFLKISPYCLLRVSSPVKLFPRKEKPSRILLVGVGSA